MCVGVPAGYSWFVPLYNYIGKKGNIIVAIDSSTVYPPNNVSLSLCNAQKKNTAVWDV